MKRTFLALTLALALGASAQAQTPKEVLKPYKAYRTALAADQKTEATDYAFKAWQQAEDLMGDTETTGDLAINFAELKPSYMNDKRAWKLIMKAYKRSIDLAPLSAEDPDEVEIDRRAKYLTWMIPNLSLKLSGASDKDYDSKRLSVRIEELGLNGTTFDAEGMAFRAQAAMMKKDWEAVQENSLAAMDIFDTRTDRIASIYEYAVPIFLARAYSEQDQPIEAALIYQALMTKLEKRGGHDNSISSDAYSEWLRLRDEIAGMKTDDARAIDVVSFVVPSGRKKQLSPLVRIPPVFPASFSRGSKSGFVRVKFNVDIEGRVVDPFIISSTNKSLHKPTLASLKGWRYTPNLPEARSRDVEVMIRFDLLSFTGRRMKYGDEKSRP